MHGRQLDSRRGADLGKVHQLADAGSCQLEAFGERRMPLDAGGRDDVALDERGDQIVQVADRIEGWGDAELRPATEKEVVVEAPSGGQFMDRERVEIEVASAAGERFADVSLEERLVRAGDPDVGWIRRGGAIPRGATVLIDATFEFPEQRRGERGLVEHESRRKGIKKRPGIIDRLRPQGDVVEIDDTMGRHPLEDGRLADLAGALEHLDGERPGSDPPAIEIAGNPHRAPFRPI